MKSLVAVKWVSVISFRGGQWMCTGFNLFRCCFLTEQLKVTFMWRLSLWLLDSPRDPNLNFTLTHVWSTVLDWVNSCPLDSFWIPLSKLKVTLVVSLAFLSTKFFFEEKNYLPINKHDIQFTLADFYLRLCMYVCHKFLYLIPSIRDHDLLIYMLWLSA